MPDDYAKHQAQRDQRYRDAWETPEVKAWIASLSPEDRRQHEAAGLLSPMMPKGGGGTLLDQDLAESSLAAETPDIVDLLDSASKPANVAPADPLRDERVWEILRRLIGELLTQSNVELSVECLALVSGIGFMGDSMTEIAKRHGVTRAAVSKRCVELTEKLMIPPSRAMRSLTARASYARTQNRIRRHHEQRNHKIR